jgi:hypothetical protein
MGAVAVNVAVRGKATRAYRWLGAIVVVQC